jgi:hypothetical protein
MHVLINVKSPNNISKWQMGFNAAFKGLSNTPTGLYFVSKYSPLPYYHTDRLERHFFYNDTIYSVHFDDIINEFGCISKGNIV